jgi:hypothetical protein
MGSNRMLELLDLDFPLDLPQNAAYPGWWKDASLLRSTALIFCQHRWTRPTHKVEILGDGILLGYNLTEPSGGVDLPEETSSDESRLFARYI